MPAEYRCNFDAISPIDARYYGSDTAFFEAVHPYLSEDATLRYQVLVERAIVAELESRRVAPSGISAALATAAREVTPAEIYREEEKIHHNIRAIVNCLCRRLPKPFAPYVHLFATSNDVMDTARSLALRDFTREVLLPDLAALITHLIAQAREHAATPQVGRTHGRHAVPLTVGYWLANFVDRLGGRFDRIQLAARNLRGKFSGAVGARNALALHWPDPAIIETSVLGRLGLQPSDHNASTQILHPEYLADYAHALVSMFGVLANLADDVRQLMRSEIEEMVEDRGHHVGSSTMPHKVNPKNFENVKSLWKALVPRMTTVYLDQVSEHQRDLTNSASGRFFNEMAALAAYGTRRLLQALKVARMDPAALDRNFAVGAKWSIAEPLYIALALSGHPDPYEASRDLSSRARTRSMTLLDLLNVDEGARSILALIKPELRDAVLDPKRYLGDAETRTEAICSRWELRVKSVNPRAELERPAEATLVLAG